MKQISILIMTAVLIASGCNSKPNTMAGNTKTNKKESCAPGGDCCKDKTSKFATDSASLSKGRIACKLTSPELQKRRATVLESLRKQIIEKKELTNGYAFKFPGTDKTIDELTEFIKTERECCSFFNFNLLTNGNKNETWLELTGTEGVKDFINMEMELY
jgi:hypothetical protein